MNLTFSEAMLATVVAGVPDLSQEQATGLQNFFGDPTTETPRVRLAKWIVYRHAIAAGQVSPETKMDAVNWQGIMQFLMTILPIILALLNIHPTPTPTPPPSVPASGG